MANKVKGTVVARDPALEVVSSLIIFHNDMTCQFAHLCFVYFMPQTVARLIQYMYNHELYAIFTSSKADIAKWKKAYNDLYSEDDEALHNFRSETTAGR